MKTEAQTKQCQNCKKDFTIEPDDFGFYEKIKVPSPTFCPECRYIRRLLDRNEYNLYKRKCDVTGEDIISIYRSDAPFPVYKQEYWKSDKFDAMEYGRDFDFKRPFFEQYEELRQVVPHVALVNSNSPNSEYTNQSGNNKDCYMLVTSEDCEKCMYGSWCQGCYFLSDCYMAEKSEFCCECINITKCSNCAWVYDSSDCVNVYFSSDCRGCTDCFGCVGLRSKQYYYLNENIGKEEYKKRIQKIIWDRDFINESKEKFLKVKTSIPVKFFHGSNIKNSTGDYLQNTERTQMAFNCRDNKDTAYIQDAWMQIEDCRDCTEISRGKLSYEVQGVEKPDRIIVARSCFSTITDSCYCDMCFSAQDCFGCFGLKQKQYCIFNKQYSKEDYLVLKEKIIEHMRKTKEWGEYFPANVSPFAYNESMAQDYFPLTKEQALRAGHTWYERPSRDYKITLKTLDLPKTVDDIKENITTEIIQCSSQNSPTEKEKYPLCTTAFNVTDLELTLYKKMKIPLPEKCFPCRRQDRFALRNPRKLWHRTCMCDKKNHFHEGAECEVEFETSYAPDRPEIIYCEKCYQAEVY
ncbi:MAG: hypothetical protein UR90_C0008G0008 [Parcubacteria group bacterium GW2011_GWC1_35_8]|uniref:Uncharacterized protein n=1 Tax=Candidatus Nomurabacteria bacterium GW2011_GWC2_35_8 TaxID=1618752 RepID=A0A0G0GAM4_9BACT|nr:MAG: hypothetical protein UR90_C0008G0008 [Parcubacteria group bacterium GW2011_GWC1_35_8]KKP88762.1 MAG: hypothetical protein UR91_C0013G0008 [Candidatus Nomurabacteria bacterium GW2011_GWC2_35_8]